MRFAYPVEIRTMTEDEGGGFLVEFPDWNGAVTDGADLDEAMENARDCLDELLAYHIRKRLPFPSPSAAGNRRLIAPEAGIALKAAFWLGLYEHGMDAEALAVATLSSARPAQACNAERYCCCARQARCGRARGRSLTFHAASASP